MTRLFDGPGGALVGPVMAKANAAAEAEAVALLDPAPSSHVVVLGFGPGVGIAILAKRLTSGFIFGVDPSGAMHKQAARRNRDPIAAGRVRLERTGADRIPAPDATFDGAVAVNTLQLCAPFADTARELARVLKPGAAIVSITHDWAAAKTAGSAEAWVAATLTDLAAAGFPEPRAFAAQAENGRAIALVARRG